MTRVRTLLTLGTGIVALAILTGCDGTTTAGDPAGSSSTAPSEPVAITCETIVSTSFAEELLGMGWSAREEPFRIGEHELTDGIQCIWGDATTGSEVAQMYGWVPVDDETSSEMQQYLEDNGWIREEEGDAIYLTENPEFAPYVGDDGYGMTYQFGEGWITLADTKSGLRLIIPRG
ncbi:hypothetical protein [Microbacterium sp. G2-8]|uniref:hypothetical protein n=1 Tax=Microbacterium sp. G2-8 TaxID=2842454 RepID=UPI001C89FA3C|nr:hypothetical protein [Microbacterium sp. G2-8]